MVRSGFVVPTQICSCSLFPQYPHKNDTSLDSQRKGLYNYLNYVNVANGTEVYPSNDFKSFNLNNIF